MPSRVLESKLGEEIQKVFCMPGSLNRGDALKKNKERGPCRKDSQDPLPHNPGKPAGWRVCLGGSDPTWQTGTGSSRRRRGTC